MEVFLEALLQAAQQSAVPVGPAPSPVDVDTGELRLVVRGENRRLPLVPLFAQYSLLKSDDERHRFTRHVMDTYVIEGRPLPAPLLPSWEDIEDRLMPLLVTEAWVAGKAQDLPQGITLPSLTPDGEPGFASGLGLVAILDYGSGCAPVTSHHLEHWGRPLSTVLVQATVTLRMRTQGEPWHTHVPGCASSKWCDGYDSTRLLLLPDLVTPGARAAIDAAGLDFPTGYGDLVAVFLTSSQCVVCGARNPLGLCYLGEMACDVRDHHPQELLSAAPFRLVAANESGRGPHWVTYHPASGEFPVPTSTAECDAVLGSLPGNQPLPPNVPGSTNSGEERAAGNTCFRAKDWAGAVAHYTAALPSAGPADRIACLANRAAAALELGKYRDALTDCCAVLAADPRHPKAWYRRGMAHVALREFESGIAAFEQLRACDPGERAPADTQLARARQLRQEFGIPVDWKAEVTATMHRPPPLTELPTLLAAVADWHPDTKAPEGPPGWLPRAVEDTLPARRAAIRLYALLRDEAGTKRDAGANSPYTVGAPTVDHRQRHAALRALADLRGDRSLVLLALANAAVLSGERNFLVPFHHRTLTQLLATVMAVPELSAAALAFQKGMETNTDLKAILNQPTLLFP